MLVQPPVVFGGSPPVGIQRGARPPVDDAMVLVEIRAKHPVLIDPQMQELQPVVLVAEARIPSVGTRMRPAFRIDPARPRPQGGRVRVRTRHAGMLHFAHHPLIGGADAVPPVRVAVGNRPFAGRFP